jgi:hypothetical protein
MELHSLLDALEQCLQMVFLPNLIVKVGMVSTRGGHLVADGMKPHLHVFRSKLPQEGGGWSLCSL